ncbi:unnamed protein product [Allacma fusca]|uniref:Uncharacterized protein n=1 Tax=Allacma fusca TaxID=39272 RepID=A0A8J2JR78_9HEXA|nr:unnamed protein product [Allacma fusca]
MNRLSLICGRLGDVGNSKIWEWEQRVIALVCSRSVSLLPAKIYHKLIKIQDIRWVITIWLELTLSLDLPKSLIIEIKVIKDWRS